MRMTPILATAVLTCATAGAASEPTGLSRMKVVPMEQAKFVPVSPRLPDGPQMAVLWGDPAHGPSAMLLKMKKGAGPLHWHTSDYHLVVLQGRMKHWGEGETEAAAPELGPGSYWFQPGRSLHADSCLSDECLMQIVWSGKRDGHLPPVAPVPPQGAYPDNLRRANYTCDNGENIEMRYFSAQGVAVMVRHGKPVELQQQVSGSGFIYSNGPNTVRGKGDDLTVEIGRMAPIHCKAAKP